MSRLFSLWILAMVVGPVAAQQTLQTKLAYEDRSGTSGHQLIIEGKTFGPYREVLSTSVSTSGTTVAFVVSKRDRQYILAQGKEAGPLPAGFEVDRLQIADDGKVWVLTATRMSSAESDPIETLLWVNGKAYGPYLELTTVEYAEAGGSWIAAVRTAEDEADVLLSGKSQGPFFTVDHAWLTPDGRAWGYAVSDSEGIASVVTSEKTWKNVVASNFAALYPREPHWGYALSQGEDEDRIVVDGQVYSGYRNFQGLILTPSGNHWGFEAEKLSDTGDTPILVIDGKEYVGEGLGWSRLGSQEFFLWSYRDGAKTSIQTLRLN